jgi:hypothetical protein
MEILEAFATRDDHVMRRDADQLVDPFCAIVQRERSINLGNDQKCGLNKRRDKPIIGGMSPAVCRL